jgi:hypothetical protein
MPSHPRSRLHAGGALLLVLLAIPRPAAAADVEVSLPVVTAAPGATVQIPIETDVSLAPFGVESIHYALPLDPAYVSGVTLLPEGLVWTWGGPFGNVTGTLITVLAVGTTPITSGSTLLHTLEFQVSPTAPLDTDMPLSFSTLVLNEGAPSTQGNLGLLQIRSGGVDVPRRATGFSLAPPAPNPARRESRFAFELPAAAAGALLRLQVVGVDGRRVRTLREQDATPGPGEVRWDLLDDAGRRVAPGLYFCVLDCAGARLTRRTVVTSP